MPSLKTLEKKSNQIIEQHATNRDRLKVNHNDFVALHSIGKFFLKG